MPDDAAIRGRLRRAEQNLNEADRLLQRRRTELGDPGAGDFEDHLLQGVRELAAVVRDLAARDEGFAPVSASHAAELAATATTLDIPNGSDTSMHRDHRRRFGPAAETGAR